MGVCINYTVGIERGRVKKTLDRTERLANEMKEQGARIGVEISVRRDSDTFLQVDVGNCESLVFDFKTYKEHGAGEYSYVTNVLEDKYHLAMLEKDENTYDHYRAWPEQVILWSAGFSKTQFSKSLAEHRYVAELVRSVAQVARYANVYDEGDYYHTLEIEDAAEAIDSNGAIIGALTGMLTAQGWKDTEITKCGETSIKARKRK